MPLKREGESMMNNSRSKTVHERRKHSVRPHIIPAKGRTTAHYPYSPWAHLCR
jgi:hypothetical protein